MSFTVTGADKGAGEFLRLKIEAARLDGDIKKAVRKLAKEGRQELIAKLSKPGTGRFYKAAGERRQRTFSRTRRLPAYHASAPGQPPVKASGNLLASVRTKFPRREGGYGAKVFETRGLAWYRHLLEFGAGPAKRGKRKGAGGERAPRPVFTPMQREYEGRLDAAIRQAIDDFVR